MSNSGQLRLPETSISPQQLSALREAAPTLQSNDLSRGKTERQKGSKSATFAAFVVLLALVTVTLLLLESVHLKASPDGSGFLYHLTGGLWLIASVHAALLAHEGGHALAARLAGWRVELVLAGLLLFDRRENERWRVRLSQMLFVGVAYSRVRSWPGVEQFRRSFRTIVAGGPIGSFVGFLIGVTTLVAVARIAGANPPRWAGFVEVATFFSLVLAVMNLVPRRIRPGFYTDGAQLERWRPFDASGVTRRAWIPIAAAAQLSVDRRPGEWDAEVVTLLESSTGDPEMGGVAAAFLAYRALDLAEPTSAAQWLQRAIDHQHVRSGEAIDSAQAHIALAATIYEGAWRRDADAARRWIAISRSAKLADAWLREIAVAALHWADGKAWHLDQATRRFRAIQAASPNPVSGLLLQTTIERMTTIAQLQR